MFPILPILILFLLGPANVERLAVEGRLPAGLLAVHLARVAPIRATVVAPVEEKAPRTAALSSGARFPVHVGVSLPTLAQAPCFDPGCPPRAGPTVA